MEAVVRDLSRPDEIPQRVAELGSESAPRRGEKLREERRAARLQDLAEPIVDRAVWARLRCRPKETEVLGEEERDLSVLGTERAPAHPHDRAGPEERVEVTRIVFRDARRKDSRLEIRRRHERALELRDRVEERGLPTFGRIDAVPGHRESTERVLFNRLDLAAQSRERSSAQRAQHSRVDPLRS